MKTTSFGVVGIHGFSRSHINSIQALIREGAPVRFPAAVGHARHLDEAYAACLEQAGVRLVPDLDALLALHDELDVITLPVGIPLHVPMATRALEAGYHVYLEKPLAGDLADGLALERVAARASGRLFIGYQDMFQPVARNLKQVLLAGELGAVRRISVVAAWPRFFSYYARNNWAGKLAVNGVRVFDCPANNACAHYLNLALFWAGRAETESAAPVTVTAELARANAIESADTTCLRVATRENVEVLFLASHACKDLKGPLFHIACEKGEIVTQRAGKDFSWTIRRPGREPEVRDAGYAFVSALGGAARAVRGEDVPVGTIDQALAQTRAINGAFLSSPVQEAPAAVVRAIEPGPGERQRIVVNMNEILDACYAKGLLPSETGLAPWVRPGRPVAVETLTAFG